MNETRPPEPLRDRSYNPDDEIGIITLVKYLWKWKILILSVTLFCALAGLVVSLFMTKIYRIDMLMEEVVVGIKPNGESVYLGIGPSIKSAIEPGKFNDKILTSLRDEIKDVLPRTLSFKVSLENSNHFIRVAYETANVKLGAKILSIFPNLLKNWSLGPIEVWKKDVNNKVLKRHLEIDNLERGIETINRSISLVKLEQERERLEEKRRKERERSQKETSLFRVNAQIDSGKDYIKYVKQKLDEINADIEANQSYIAFLIKHSKQMVSQKGEDKYSLSKGNFPEAIGRGFEVLDTAKDSANTLEEKMRDRMLEVEILKYDAMRLRKEIEQLSAEIVKLGALESMGREIERDLSDKLIEPAIRESAGGEIERDLETTINDKSSKIRRLEAQIKIDNLQAKISVEENNIRVKREEINNFETDKKNVKNVQVLQPPTVSAVPIRPRTERIVGIAAVAGFFLSLLLALSMGYVSKNKRRESD